MSYIINEEPCLVKSGQGFSVSYKDKLLYSKYNPQKNIQTIIENINILEGTLILCISPVLEYGLEELAKKLPNNSLMLGCEIDEKLFDIAKKQSENLLCTKENKFILLPPNEVFELPERLCKKRQNANGIPLPELGSFKRVIKIEFSAGFTFNKDFYENLFTACRNSISQFWKNRITLIKFGRRYSSNIFKNLSFLFEVQTLPKISKPILVCAAGESAWETLKYVKTIRNNICLIVTDVLLPTLKDFNICADFVICEESQQIIAQAFTGCKNSFKTLICSLTSCPSLPKKRNAIFYLSMFCEANFLNKIKSNSIVKTQIPPLGSVGLSAIHLALLMRSSNSVPVFFSGMDFSFSLGKSHVKLSMHDKKRRSTSNRIHSFYFVANEWLKITGKDGNQVFSNKIMISYAELFEYMFAKSKNLFDCGKTGINLGIKQLSIEKIKEYFSDKNDKSLYSSEERLPNKNAIKMLEEELSALIKLRNILTGKEKIPQESLEKTIMNILKEREYLYLHFPDGYKPSCEKQFLNRVRIEIDYFIKVIKNSLNYAKTE